MRNKSGFYIATENDGIFQLTYKNNLFKVLKIIADKDFDFTVYRIFMKTASQIYGYVLNLEMGSSK